MSKRAQEGYILIDHRAGPGISAEFIRRSGKEAPSVPEGSVFESATVTCSHCHAIVIMNPNRTRARAYCQRCDHYVCDSPVCAIECRPMNRLLDQIQEQAFRLQGKE